MKLRTHLVLMLSISTLVFAILSFLIADKAFIKTDNAIHQAVLGREADYLCGQVRSEGIQKEFLDDYAGAHEVRLTIIDSNGEVLYDNESDPSTMDNHAWRKEVERTLENGEGSAIRHSDTLQTDMVYVAKLEGSYIVRISSPVSAIDTWRSNFIYSFIPWIAVFLALLLILGIVYVSHLLRPLSKLSEAAEIWSEGKLSHKLEPQGPQEFQIMAKTINTVAGGIARRMKTTEEERQRYASILDTMLEGVILVDTNGSPIMENRAAKEAEGEFLLQNPAIMRTIRQTMKSGNAETTTAGNNGHIFSITTAPIHENAQVGGVVLTMSDITRIQQLEQVRRDFVANVSHELKTPLTSILGFSDILVAEHLEEDERIHYATIILKGAKRMQGIITDLLTLSSLETEGKQFPMEHVNVSSLIDDAREAVHFASDQKQMTITVQDCKGAQVTCARNLMVEAVSNLLSNAIRYSPEQTEIVVSVKETEKKETVISVTDHGCGISPENQKRIFERFYRVDKARSRAQGGTGLGLSIVRHVMLIHHGSVQVESVLGQGSTFSLVLPSDQEETIRPNC